jgi:hypothetical protein
VSSRHEALRDELDCIAHEEVSSCVCAAFLPSRLASASASVPAPGAPTPPVQAAVLPSKSGTQSWSQYFGSPGWAEELRLQAEVSEPFQIRADDAAAAALSALCWHWGQPEDAVVAAVHYGGDTDTVAAITGTRHTLWAVARLGVVGTGHGRGRWNVRQRSAMSSAAWDPNYKYGSALLVAHTGMI